MAKAKIQFSDFNTARKYINKGKLLNPEYSGFNELLISLEAKAKKTEECDKLIDKRAATMTDKASDGETTVESST